MVNRDLPIPASPESRTTCPSPSFALDQRRSSSCVSSSLPTRLTGRCRETPQSFPRGSRPQRSPDLHGAWNTLQILKTKVLQLEQIADQSSRGCRDHNHVWFGKTLQSCGEVGCLANYSPFLRLSRSDEIADDNYPVAMPTGSARWYLF